MYWVLEVDKKCDDHEEFGKQSSNALVGCGFLEVFVWGYSFEGERLLFNKSSSQS